ncbi:unnamed protein product [Ectocarpus sp. CCAP 1310/34]|nr:unnamed protein product [Ectocarpus sp. CCAP 1310/34]
MISKRQLPVRLFDCPFICSGVYAESQVWILRKPAHRCSQDLCGPDGETIEEGGKWKESAKDPEVWYNKVEDGAAWFMRKWHRQEAEASAKRQRAREAEAESTAISGPKRKRVGEAAVGGKKRRPGTAVEASRVAEAALVANYVPG